MNKLAVFDIDGTLIKHLPEGNDKCYVQAFAELFGITGIADNPAAWSSFKTSTDSGISREIHLHKLGREMSPADQEKFRKHEQNLLENDFRCGGQRYESTRGAERVLDYLRNTAGWDVAIATGNWEQKGRLKLASAGVAHEHVSVGGAEDSEDRAEIIRIAAGRAGKARGIAGYEKMVFIGDRPWDIDAAKRLKIGFVGIGSGAEAQELRDAGAKTILADLSDVAALVSALEKAEP